MKIKYTYETGVALFAVLLVGLFYSRFMISCGTVGLCLLWLLYENKKEIWNRWARNKLALSASVILVICLVSFLNTENTAGYLASIKNKIPYFFIPLSMAGMHRISGRGRELLLYLFILLLLLSGAWTLLYYITHMSSIATAYSKGQILPTVIHHVSYSFLLVTGVLFMVNGCLNTKNKWLLSLYFALSLWLIFMIHLLAVRTGIICLYVALPVYLFCICIERGAFRVLVLSIIALSITGIVLFSTVDTLQKKADYVLYDLKHIHQNINTDNQLSDTRRLLSDQLGWEIAIQHPWAGVGIGDVQDAMNELYNTTYPTFTQETRGHIHNQFIYIFAGCGFVLGIIFILAIVYPVWYFFRHRSFLLASVYLGLILVLFWEPFLEYQLGNTIYLLVLALGVNQTSES